MCGAVLAEAGATPAHICRMTWYLTDKREYLARGREIGAAYRELIGHYAGGDVGGAGQRADGRPRLGGDRGHCGAAAAGAIACSLKNSPSTSR